MSRVTINDVRKAGYCVAGTRQWARLRGLDFSKFLNEGLTEDEVLAFDDAMGSNIVARKRAREAAPHG